MRTWRLAVCPLRCGLGGCPIAVGDPYLEIQAQGALWRKTRCRGCAGEPVGPVVADNGMDSPSRGPVVTVPAFTRVGVVASDWKSRQAGE